MNGLWLRSLRGVCRHAFGREAQSPAVLSCQGGGGGKGVLALALGEELLQSPAARSPLRRAGHSPARWPLLPRCPLALVLRRRLPEGSSGMAAASWGTVARGPRPGDPAAPVARSSREEPGTRSPSPPPTPASCPPRGAPARPSWLERQRAHSPRGRLQGYPRVGGWDRLPPLASSAAFLSPRPFRRSQATVFQTPKQNSSKVRAGKSSCEADRRQGGGRP